MRPLRPLPLRLLLVLLTLGLGAGAGRASAATRHTPTLGPTQTVVDGPSSDIASLDGMSVARDGTGGLVYLKDVGGVAHVFVSRLLGGAFGPPQQVDAGLSAGSGQPVIAAAPGGLLLVAFVNGGEIQVAQTTAATQPIGAPSAIGPGGSPSLAISPAGKGYLVYASGGQVVYDYWSGGTWTAGSGPLDATASDPAGEGTDRPQVAAGGEGIGIAVWGEGGHVYVRRLDGATPSVEVQPVDPPSVDGFGEVSATGPVVGCVGYSTYAGIGFSETVSAGGQTQTRVLYGRLDAELVNPAAPADGLNAGAAENGGQAAIAVTEYGAGLLTTQTSVSHQLDGDQLVNLAVPTTLTRLDSLSNTAAPDAAPATAGIYSDFVAWQQSPGVSGPAEIRLRYAPDGVTFGPEEVISNPGSGPTDADAGLVDGGDLAGDAAVAWVQDAPAGPEIVAVQLAQAPGPFAPGYAAHDYASLYPTLSWSVPAESWGGVTYSVTLDGRPLTSTTATSIRPGPLAQGGHVWQVSATNAFGVTTTARPANVLVDTVAPASAFTLRGDRSTGAKLVAAETAHDRTLPGEPAASASGVARVVARWGDGSVLTTTRPSRVSHVYRRAGRYTIEVTAYDNAGNRTTAVRRIRIGPSEATLARRRRPGSR